MPTTIRLGILFNKQIIKVFGAEIIDIKGVKVIRIRI